MDLKDIEQKLIEASERNSHEDLIAIAEKMQSEVKREMLIRYEISMRSCSDEQAEIMVDSYLASTSV
jgi:hypothetical protein